MMLEAIERASKSITMCTYIFDSDRAGNVFANALRDAAGRSVEVRVLVDDVGSKYSWPPGIRLLAGSAAKVATFLPTIRPWWMRYSNLRNHRKLLVIDGTVAFTGGINIREGNYVDDPGRSPIRDVHFQIEGPVVHQLQEVFAVDWSFTTGEQLEGDIWYGTSEPQGKVLARAISDGPDEEIDRLHNTILGAISCASRRITIVTPYFIPDHALTSSLNTAAMRGIKVDIVLPQQGNLRLVQWASIATIPQVMESGCRIWLSPPPFDHSKLMIVDDEWTLIGSANWDQRSLRLNFELNVECYDAELARRLLALAEARIAVSSEFTPETLAAQTLPIRLRNNVARLASPYL